MILNHQEYDGIHKLQELSLNAESYFETMNDKILHVSE